MDKQSSDFKTLIFDLANGSLDLEHFPVEESKYYVENEYEEGKPDTEDRDIEIIIDNLLTIGKYLSMKMYDYGWFFAEQRKNN